MLLHAQVARYKSVLDTDPQSGNFSTPALVDFSTGTLSQNAIDAQFSDRYRDQLNATLTWHLDKLGGSHTFKTGFDVQQMKFDFEQFIPSGQSFTCYAQQQVPDDPATCHMATVLDHTVDHPAGTLENKGIVGAYFIQDDWRIHPNVTLNLGLRYEGYSYDDDTGHKILEGDLLEPRVGAAWDVTGDARNVLKAYVGQFADPSILALPRVVNTHASSQDFFINENIAELYFGEQDQNNPDPDLMFDINNDGTFDSNFFFQTFGGPGGSVIAHGGKLDVTNVWEASVSYERQFSAVTSGALTLVRRTTHDIIEDVFDQNAGVYVIDNVDELRGSTSGPVPLPDQGEEGLLWASYPVEGGERQYAEPEPTLTSRSSA